MRSPDDMFPSFTFMQVDILIDVWK